MNRSPASLPRIFALLAALAALALLAGCGSSDTTATTDDKQAGSKQSSSTSSDNAACQQLDELGTTVKRLGETKVTDLEAVDAELAKFTEVIAKISINAGNLPQKVADQWATALTDFSTGLAHASGEMLKAVPAVQKSGTDAGKPYIEKAVQMIVDAYEDAFKEISCP